MNKITPFKCESRESDNSRSVHYAVHGFWSGENVRVSQSKSWKSGLWEMPEVNWSCGGRDWEQEPNNALASECFAKAVFAAVEVARQWEKECPADAGKDS